MSQEFEYHGGIRVRTDEIVFVREDDGVTEVRLKSGETLRVDRDGLGKFGNRNMGETVVAMFLADRIRRNPLFDMTRPLGLKLPGSD